MRSKLFVIGMIAVMAVAAHASIGPIPLNCNRACLEDVVNQYLAALVARDPKRLPLSKDVMYTENDQVVEIGDGFSLAGLRGSDAHDEILRDAGGYRRETNRAGGLEAGVSNGEEIVVRAAMKPLPTLMKPLRSADLETGEPAQALVERSDVAAVEALAVVAEACVAFELARAAREKFGGDSVGDFVAAWRAYVERIPWSPR